MTFPNCSETCFFANSLRPSPEANKISSVSQITARHPLRSLKDLVVPSENFSSVAIGEYFLSISSSLSVNISSGSPSLMRSVRRISFGITTLPSSSILLTIPVAFIFPSLTPRLLRLSSKKSMRNFFPLIPKLTVVSYLRYFTPFPREVRRRCPARERAPAAIGLPSPAQKRRALCKARRFYPKFLT